MHQPSRAVDRSDPGLGPRQESHAGIDRRVEQLGIEPGTRHGDAGRQAKPSHSAPHADPDVLQPDAARPLGKGLQTGGLQDCQRVAVQAAAADLLPGERPALDQEHPRAAGRQLARRHRARRSGTDDDRVPSRFGEVIGRLRRGRHE